MSRSFQTIKVDFSGGKGIAEIVLSRPEQANALLPQFFVELPRAVTDLEEGGETRAIIISGEGKNFCSGMDFSFFGNEMLSTESTLDRERFRRLVLQFQSALSVLEQCRIPVITAIQGACVGAAVDLISACDMRFASADAFFAIQEINIGIMADLGTLQRLPKIMPEGIVRELAYTGDRLDAARALSCGLVNKVFPAFDEMHAHVHSVAERISGRSPLAVSASKSTINYVRDHTVADALDYAATLQAAIFDKQQVVDAVTALKKKSDVTYPNLKSSRVTVQTVT